MGERPIIFGAPMVRALLAGRKSQTRRVLKLPTNTRGKDAHRIYEHPKMGGWEATTSGGGGCFTIARDGSHVSSPERVAIWHRTCGVCIETPYQVGDRLWVREAHAIVGSGDPGLIITRTDYPDCVPSHYENVPSANDVRWRSPIHMPRWASRLTLTVTDVRVQRLQDISEEDAEAEGCEFDIWDQALAVRNYGRKDDGWYCMWGGPSHYTHPDVYRDEEVIWRASFQSLWNSIHGPDAWSANPWIAALTFTVHHGNIDALPDALPLRHIRPPAVPSPAGGGA